MKKNLLIIFPIIFSTSIFAQWVQIKEPDGHQYNAFAVIGSKLFSATDYGLYASLDYGASWSTMSITHSNYPVKSFTIKGTSLFAGGLDYIFKSIDNGISWTTIPTGFIVQVLTVSGKNLFAGTYANYSHTPGVFLSSDDGTSWTAVNTGLTSTVIHDVTACGGNIFASTDSGVFRSSNDGGNWVAVNNGLKTGYGYYFIGFATIGTKLFLSAFNNNNGRVYFSSNNGTDWNEASNGLPGSEILAFAVSGVNLFAAVDPGVFLSTNDGTSWTDVNLGLPRTFVRSLTVCGDFLIAGTYHGAVWRRSLAEMITSVEDKQSNLPTQFLLSQNYPNPFNPSTTIEYQVPTQTYVVIKLFNSLGQEIRTLVSGEKNSGRYELLIDGSDLVSGVYFCQMRAGNFVETKKIVLMK